MQARMAERDERPAFSGWLARFRDAPRETTLIPFWFWNDDLDEAEIVRQIDGFADHGVHGFVIHPRMGLPPTIPFMSDRYLHFVRVAVDRAAEKEMIVHLYDEGMYPSGSAGGRVVAENPRFAARCLLCREESRSAAEHRESRSPVDPGEHVVDTVEWNGGRRFLLIDAPSRGKIRGVHFGQDDGEPGQPPAADLLNPAATASFLRHVHERYHDALRGHFGTTVRAIFTDEPDLLGRGHRKGAQPWTTGFEEILRRELGAGAVSRLPELWFERGQESLEFRRAFRRAVHARLEETFYRPLSDWCAARGVALTGHPAGPGEIGVLRHFQIPGQDVVWRYVEPGKPSALEGPQSVVAKCGSSSAAHRPPPGGSPESAVTEGPRRVRNGNEDFARRVRNGNEAFGAYGWSLTFEEMDWLTDWLLIRGVDLIWPHAFYYSVRGPRRDERPPDVGPNNTWWDRYRPYADRVRRLCWVLATGTHRADVAILGGPDELPWAAAKVCFERQRDFNYLEPRLLLDGSAAVDGDGIRIGAMRYRALILDGADPPPAPVLSVLRPLIEMGRAAAYGEATIDGVRRLAAPGDLAAWLDGIAVPDLIAAPPFPGLRCRHVTQDGAEVFLLFNESEERFEGEIRLPGIRGGIHVVDPCALTAVARPEGPPLRLSLEPHASVLLVAPPAPAAPSPPSAAPSQAP